jgi:hypothetical protein
MITDQNIAVVSRGPVTARIQHDARFYRGAAAVLEGDATRERPLHFVLLACHADMADESPITTTERMTNALAEEVLARLGTKDGDEGDVLQASNAAAVATDRYYSIVVGRVTQRRVSVGALGSVVGVIVNGKAAAAIITPNVVRIGDHAILDGVFGLGFRQEAVQVKEFDLEDEATLLLMIGEDTSTAPMTAAHHQDVEAIIESVLRAARISPPIVAVVR